MDAEIKKGGRKIYMNRYFSFLFFCVDGEVEEQKTKMGQLVPWMNSLQSFPAVL